MCRLVSDIEKHVTLSRSDKGADSEFSLEPDELQKLCTETRDAWSALGIAGYERKPVENASMKFRRSIYVVEDIKAGEKLSGSNIKRIRPGFGLPPKYFDELIGKTANVDLERGTALDWDYVE